MISRHARRRFMIMSFCSLLLGALFLLETYQPRLFDAKAEPIAIRVLETIAAMPAVLGGLCMFFGMEWYCLELDTSKKYVRVLRALAMLLTMPLGQIVYYFLVYRPQTACVEMRLV
jgi:hypothetical protein